MIIRSPLKGKERERETQRRAPWRLPKPIISDSRKCDCYSIIPVSTFLLPPRVITLVACETETETETRLTASENSNVTSGCVPSAALNYARAGGRKRERERSRRSSNCFPSTDRRSFAARGAFTLPRCVRGGASTPRRPVCVSGQKFRSKLGPKGAEKDSGKDRARVRAARRSSTSSANVRPSVRARE